MISLPISAEDITQIVAIDDPVLRNLWITQSYADFASRLRTAIGPTDHSWCGFAVWASATAGQSIREQELPGIVDELLGAEHHQRHIAAINEQLQRPRFVRAVRRLDGEHIRRAIRGALDNVSQHIAHGNTLVFAELAPLFVAFLELFDRGGPESQDAVDAALDRAATEPIDDGLREAFTWYWRAARPADERERARAILAANVLAVAHEQKRLQADIADSLDAGLNTAGQILDEVLPRWVPRFAARLLNRTAAHEIDRLVTDVWEATTTELLMTLRVPGATLHLRDDVPPGPGDRRFPADLADLTDAPPDSVFTSWDRTGGTGVGCGARDWAVLQERMNYIVNLFRSRQQDPSLDEPPFTGLQLDAMQHRRVPQGSLLPRR